MKSLLISPKQISVLSEISVEPRFLKPSLNLESKNTTRPRSKTPKFISIPFNMLSFLGLSPIYVWSNNDHISTFSLWPQTLFCGILHPIALIFYAFDLIGVFQTIQLHKSPELVGIIISQTSKLFYILLVFRIRWFSRLDLDRLFRTRLALSKKLVISVKIIFVQNLHQII